jgi:hypothetical protein
MKIEKQVIHRAIITIQQGKLTGEEQATIAVNIQRGHLIKSISQDDGEIIIVMEMEGELEEVLKT